MVRAYLFIAWLTVAGFGVSISSGQTTWYVDNNACPGPGSGTAEAPFCSIQAGIDAAADGDTVRVADGVYSGAGNENINLLGKAILLRSENGPRSCVIDVDPWEDGFVFPNDEGAESIVEGFLVENAGQGFRCTNGAAPMLRDMVFRYGGRGGVCEDDSHPVLRSCVLRGNREVGIKCYDNSSPSLIGCTISDNNAGVFSLGSSHVVLTNSLVWRNPWPIWHGGDGEPPEITYSCVEGGYDGEGNTSADPLLARDGVHVGAGSACINAGYSGAFQLGAVDTDGEPRLADGHVDIGVDEFLDSDADGLPDWWGQRHFGSSAGGSSVGDDDGDGLANVAEYLASRDPLRGPTIYYADEHGNDEWDGKTNAWDGLHGPKATIQAALDCCSLYEGDQIVLADGTFRGPGNRDILFGGKAVTIRSANGPAGCFVDCEQSGRAFHFTSHELADSVVDGLTITGGFVLDANGGGILCEYAHPTIMNCIIEYNTASSTRGYLGNGGGIYGKGAEPTVRDCIIRNNEAIEVGCEGTGKSGCGGGIYLGGGGGVLANCEICGNSASSECVYDSSCGSGGGVYLSLNPITLAECTISLNTANWGGGGVTATDLGARFEHCSIRDNRVWGGNDYSAGGVLCYAPFPGYPMDCVFDHCEISGNMHHTDAVAGSCAGAISCYTGVLEITNSVIAGNRSWGGTDACGGAGVHVSRDCATTVVNSVIAWNAGGGSGATGICAFDEMPPTIIDSVVWGNAQGQVFPPTATVQFSAVEDGFVGQGNTHSDPRFRTAGSWDYGQPETYDDDVWIDGDFRLLPSSPCIDAGDPEVEPIPGERDLDGHARVLCGRVDMGAYESGIGDSNCDGTVGLPDFSAWEFCFTGPGGEGQDPYATGCLSLDFDYDGDIDLADYAGFLAVFAP